jgi:hypothetical protein
MQSVISNVDSVSSFDLVEDWRLTISANESKQSFTHGVVVLSGAAQSTREARDQAVTTPR